MIYQYTIVTVINMSTLDDLLEWITDTYIMVPSHTSVLIGLQYLSCPVGEVGVFFCFSDFTCRIERKSMFVWAGNDFPVYEYTVENGIMNKQRNTFIPRCEIENIHSKLSGRIACITHLNAPITVINTSKYGSTATLLYKHHFESAK